MSITAPWLRLASDFADSPMFDAIDTPGPLLAWVGLLCEAKERGRGGRFTLRRAAFCRRYRVSPADLDACINASRGAMRVSGDVYELTNWKRYQDSNVLRKAKNEGERSEQCDLEQSTRNTPTFTTHTSQSQLPSQEELNAARSPASAAKPADSGGGKSPMSGGKTPTGKTEQVALDRERWVWVGTEGRRAAWEAAYPAVDIDAELAKAAVWCRENGSKGYRKNFGRFLANWLSRCQERGGTRGGTLPFDPATQHQRDTDKLIAELKARDAAKAAGETPW